MMNSLLSIVLSYLIRHYEEAMETAVAESSRLQKLEAMLVHIESNFRTITLRELAEKFYFTEQYLSKYIKGNTGKTFIEIVRDIRLKNAQKLLSTTDLLIGEISEASGYTSVEHFTRQFKREFSVSPTNYRKLKSI